MSSLHRFFVAPDALRDDRVTLDGPIAHQIRRVLRLTPGDRILLLDNAGWQYEVELTAISSTLVQGTVQQRTPAAGEPRVDITVHQALLKSDRFEYVLQKGTEVGITRFVPTICDRCVADLGDHTPRRLDRWRRIVQEAAEQSRRGHIPDVAEPTSFADAVHATMEGKGRREGLFLWEEAGGRGLRAVLREAGRGEAPRAFDLYVGPEGGFTGDEASLARSAGLTVVTLGPRILRAETAALVASSAIMYELGQFEVE